MKRYAIYYVPPHDAFAKAAASWLGYDVQTGCDVAQPDFASLPREIEVVTADPRKYGFHGTIKPPFRLAAGATPEDLAWATEALCLRLSPVVLTGLRLERIGGFLALVPEADTVALFDLAARVVEALDAFRAPPTADEIARRSPGRLTPRQRDYLDRWGYPFVMDEFRFHMTLTGDLPPDDADTVARVLARWIAPHLPRPCIVDNLCLFGEAEDGRFHLLHRYTLTG